MTILFRHVDQRALPPSGAFPLEVAMAVKTITTCDHCGKTERPGCSWEQKFERASVQIPQIPHNPGRAIEGDLCASCRTVLRGYLSSFFDPPEQGGE